MAESHRNNSKRLCTAGGPFPASITALCNDERAWISRETAERIAEVTGHDVTPNDFLGLAPSPARGSSVTENSIQDRVEAAVEAFARGEIVVVTDDDDRENEGDLIMAASLATPEKMAFIIRNTSGIVCTPLPPSEARRLRLDPMVSVNDAPLSTAFTISIDVRHGTTTGISAEERTNTVRALANPNMGAADFVRPAISSPSSPGKAACSCARAIPRRRWICAGWPMCPPSGSFPSW